MKAYTLFAALFLSASAAFVQTAAFNGFCDLGGVHAVTQGLPAANFQQTIIPSCTIAVYLTGTTTPATIYADAISTPLSNPFTANSELSIASGSWLFFAATGQGYDVVMSGGFPPLVYPNPVTLTDLMIGGGGGGGDLSGTLTPGYIPVATAPHTLGDSTIDQGIHDPTAVTVGDNFNAYAEGPSGGYVQLQTASTTGGVGGGDAQIDVASNPGTVDIFADSSDTSANGAGVYITNSPNEDGDGAISIDDYYCGEGCVVGGGISLETLSTQGISLDVMSDSGHPGVNGPINLAANNINLYTSAPANAQLNSSQICTMATGCGGSGSPSINVDGVTVSSPNLDSTAPVADSGYTLGTWKKSGSNISVEVPNATVTSTQSVVTSSRVLGTVYQNTTGSMMLVTVMFWSNRANDSFTVKSDSNSSPSTTTVSATAGNNSSITSAFGTTFAVLPGNYYVISSSYALTIDSWTEWTIG